MIYWQNGRERESWDNFQAEPMNPFLHQTLSNWLSFLYHQLSQIMACGHFVHWV
jgi:hypothetical protein